MGDQGFPTVEPALHLKLNVATANPVGTLSTGSTLTHFETPSGTLSSIEGFSPAFKANVVFGADWLSFDADKAHGRIDLKAVARTEEGQIISFGYVGVIKMNEGLGKIFNMEPDMKTVPFGNALGSFTFHVGDPKLKDLENNMWASSSRLVVKKDGGLMVEVRISKIGADVVMD